MKQLYSDTGQQRIQDCNPERGNINKESPKIALAYCPEAVSRPGSRKDELGTQRFKVREARAPVICWG